MCLHNLGKNSGPMTVLSTYPYLGANHPYQYQRTLNPITWPVSHMPPLYCHCRSYMPLHICTSCIVLQVAGTRVGPQNYPMIIVSIAVLPWFEGMWSRIMWCSSGSLVLGMFIRGLWHWEPSLPNCTCASDNSWKWLKRQVCYPLGTSIPNLVLEESQQMYE